jgi:hypothetical protein
MTGGTYRKVVLTSGHMIDTPDRSTPRFPPELEPVVAAQIEEVLDNWDVGPGDLLLSGGARGADILFAESAHRRSSDVELILALPVDSFEQASVVLPSSIWRQRFRYLLAHHHHHVSPDDGHGSSLNEFARANADLLRRAHDLAPPAELYVALVWDEQEPGGEGGTGDFARLAAELKAPLAVINPAKLLTRR